MSARCQGDPATPVQVDGEVLGKLPVDLNGEAKTARTKQSSAFANTATPSLSNEIPEIWSQMFPMILPSDGEDGLGILALRGGALLAPSFGRVP